VVNDGLSNAIDSQHVYRNGSSELQAPLGILSGSFNPIHPGHRSMAQLAENMLGCSVEFELSVKNVDKPDLDRVEIERRLAQFSEREVVWITWSSTFQQKAAVLPPCTFVIGADTLIRIADPRYYPCESGLNDSVDELAERGNRFLVFGREVNGSFLGLESIPLPKKLRPLCQAVPESSFRMDISSTGLRPDPP